MLRTLARPSRHCERSAAIQSCINRTGLPRFARNDGDEPSQLKPRRRIADQRDHIGDALRPVG
jgi:hypothetical protein